MWYAYETQFVVLFHLCICLKLIENQSVENGFRPSNIELSNWLDMIVRMLNLCDFSSECSRFEFFEYGGFSMSQSSI